ncbi:hypothetical protein [Phaeospirillum tilakii]|uniref:AAA ATPase domain-containing protein n=1 Tax=Phaeospirillum tilakii TaxID=741673 RepID=A0ABW5CBE5_9PROT
MIDPTILFPEGPREAFETAPASLLAVSSRVDYRDALAPGDPRYVPTAEARAEKFVRHFHATFGYDKHSGGFLPPGQGKHVLFFGHVGCGKSTELSRMCQELEDPHRYWVVRIDLLELIDAHDARYSDVWLAVAQKLVDKLEEQGIGVEPVVLNRLRNWFAERVLTHEELGELKAGIDFEASAGAGLPLIAKLLARFTTSVKVGSSYRETLRTVMRNSYGDFVAALNLLITNAAAKIRAAGKGQEILFVIDGADRFRGEDWRRFFVEEVNQLVLVRCIAVYTAPMALKSSGARLDLFDSLVLPMVKLHEFDAANSRREAGFTAMRQVVLKRCHYRLFDSLETLDRLIEFSGGHLRDLLRLLYFACIEAEGAVLDSASVEAAAQRLASEYRSWVLAEDYPILVEAARQPQNLGVSEAVTRLVEGGALLEYNSGSWRQPHPVVRLLPAYLRAAG